VEITDTMVRGYTTAVTAALREAGHTTDDPFIDDQDAAAATVLIALPDALSDDDDRSGLALMWKAWHGWDVGIVAHRAANTMRIAMHTDLQLGTVPAPEVVVRAVAAIVADGSLRAGRIVPGTAELLAQYEGGTAPETVRLDLIAESEKHGSFGYCIGCGATDVVHRALYVRSTVRTTALRVAWCSADECQEDRARSAVLSVPVEAGPGGFYGVVDAW
jgi:hypothetical protein